MHCLSNCVTNLPAMPEVECGIGEKKGGISRFFFIKCNAPSPTSPCDDATLATLISACQMRVSPDIIGSKPAANFVKTRTKSCSSEKVTGGSQTIEFTDYTTTKSGHEFGFWDSIMQNADGLLVMWQDCNGNIFGGIGFTVEASHQAEDNSTGKAFIAGTVTVETHRIFEPVKFSPSTLALLQFNKDKICETNSWVDDDSIECASINLRPDTPTREYAVTAGGPAVSILIALTRNGGCNTTPISIGFSGAIPLSAVLTLAGIGSQVYDITVPAGVTAGTYKIFLSGTAACGEVGSTILFLVVS